MESLRSRLERLVSEEAGDSAADEAGQLLLEMIRIEGRVDRLLRRAGGGLPHVKGFQGIPLQEAAAHVLADAGEPLHVRELGARVKAGGWRHRSGGSRPDQLAHQLAARLPRYPAFRRVRPNTFGLAEWGSARAPASNAGQPRPIFAGTDAGLGRWISDHPEAPFEKTWPSS